MKFDTETRIVTFESKPCYGCSENGISSGKRFANEMSADELLAELQR